MKFMMPIHIWEQQIEASESRHSGVEARLLWFRVRHRILDAKASIPQPNQVEVELNTTEAQYLDVVR